MYTLARAPVNGPRRQGHEARAGDGPALVELVLGTGASSMAWVYAVGPLAGGAAAAYTFKYQES